MTDIFTKEKRSQIMRSVRSRNTDIELKLRKALFKKGYRYLINTKLPGRPDIVLPKYKTVIFCDGDFWHGKRYKKESVNYKDFWKEKIHVNIKRDLRINKILKKDGWIVLRFWKSDILKNVDSCVEKIETTINESLAI